MENFVCFRMEEPLYRLQYVNKCMLSLFLVINHWNVQECDVGLEKYKHLFSDHDNLKHKKTLKTDQVIKSRCRNVYNTTFLMVVH